MIATGAWLAEFEVDPSLPQRAAGHDSGHGHGAGAAHAAPGSPETGARSVPSIPTLSTTDLSNHLPDGISPAFGGGFVESASASRTPTAAAAPSATAPAGRDDAGTVVGAMQISNEVRRETASAVGGVKAVPAVRALAKKLGVDLAGVAPSGAEGVVTLADVKRAAERGDTRPASATTPTTPRAAPGTDASADAGFDVEAPIRGVRRNMLRSMAAAHAEVVPATLMDDADLQAWAPGEDITVRLVRALVRAAAIEPAMNAWLNARKARCAAMPASMSASPSITSMACSWPTCATPGSSTRVRSAPASAACATA